MDQLVEETMKYAVLLVIAFIHSAFAHKPLTLILDWYANPNHAALLTTQNKRFFKEAGLQVNLIEPANPTDGPKILSAGKADLVITYPISLMYQQQHGLPVVPIGTLISQPLDCLLVLKNSPIRSLADLKGKTIGYSDASADEPVLTTLLASAGLTLSDVKLINVHYNLTQALLTHQIDAIAGAMRNFEPIQLNNLGQRTRAFYPEDYGFPSHDELVIITTQNKLHDPRIQIFLSALQKGTHYLLKHPKESWALFAARYPALNNPTNYQSWQQTLAFLAKDPAKLDTARYNALIHFMQKKS